MKDLRKFQNRLRALFKKQELDNQMDDEMRSHIEMQRLANIDDGMDAEEAHYAALRQFGRVESIKETCRDQRGVSWIENLARDVRYGIRSLVKNPSFTAVAVLPLALCIGANLTIYAVVDSVLLQSPPFPEADRLLTVYNTYPKAGVEDDGASVANYYERRGKIAAFSELAIHREGTAIIGEAGSTTREQVARVSPDFFSTLGIGPVMGRAFVEEETTFEADSVAILTDAYWRQHFNADPNVVGREIRVDGLSNRVVGVLPPGFRFLSSEARIYFPLSSDSVQRGPYQRHSGNSIQMIARLRPGVTLGEAQSQIDSHNAEMEKDNPDAKLMADAGFRSIVTSLQANHVKSVRPILLLLQASVLFLLLIGGVNLVNLLLIRASGRAKELAIRQSLGASRRHVVSQVLVETVLLTLAGGVAGLAVGAGGIRLLAVLGSGHLPLEAHIVFSTRLALVVLSGTVVLGIVVALPVAWFHLRGYLTNALQSESRGSTASRAVQRLRHGFIVTQIALAFVLLTGAGLLGLSLKQVMSVNPGFRPDQTLTGRINLPWKSYESQASVVAFTDRLIEAISRQPGVLAAGAITNVPLSGIGGKSAITVKGQIVRPGESVRGHYTYGVAGDYFAALGIPLREGRLIEASDVHRDERICVVDEDFARHYWPRGGAVGQQLYQSGSGEKDGAPPFTVVGVVGAVKQTELAENKPQGAVYFPFSQRADSNFFVVTRARVPPESLGPSIRKIVREIDPELPVDDLRSMETRIAESLVARRTPALLAGIFAGVALLLAAIGTYGVLSYAVAQRRREVCVRMALGARPQQIRNQFLVFGLRLMAAGMLLGVIGAWLAGRAMQSLLFNITSLPVTALAGAAAVMTVVSLIACLMPAIRASRIDPMEVMKVE
jgi:predicted permease